MSAAYQCSSWVAVRRCGVRSRPVRRCFQRPSMLAVLGELSSPSLPKQLIFRGKSESCNWIVYLPIVIHSFSDSWWLFMWHALGRDCDMIYPSHIGAFLYGDGDPIGYLTFGGLRRIGARISCLVRGWNGHRCQCIHRQAARRAARAVATYPKMFLKFSCPLGQLQPSLGLTMLTHFGHAKWFLFSVRWGTLVLGHLCLMSMVMGRDVAITLCFHCWNSNTGKRILDFEW